MIANATKFYIRTCRRKRFHGHCNSCVLEGSKKRGHMGKAIFDQTLNGKCHLNWLWWQFKRFLPDHQVQAPACTTSLSGATRLYNPGGVGTVMAKYIYPNCKICLSQLQNILVQIAKYTCPNYSVYLSKKNRYRNIEICFLIVNFLVWIAKCIFLYCKIYFLKFHEQICF